MTLQGKHALKCGDYHPALLRGCVANWICLSVLRDVTVLADAMAAGGSTDLESAWGLP